MNLEQIRKKIDEIDDEILSLVFKRIECSKLIAEIKFNERIQVYDELREEEILNRIKLKSADDYKYISTIFEEVLASSKLIQNDIIKNKRTPK